MSGAEQGPQANERRLSRSPKFSYGLDEQRKSVKRFLLIFSALFLFASTPALAFEFTPEVTPYTASPLEDDFSYKELGKYIDEELRPVENDPVDATQRKQYEDTLEAKNRDAKSSVKRRLDAWKNHFIDQMNRDTDIRTAARRAEAELLHLGKANWYGPSKAETDRKYDALEGQKRSKIKPLRARQSKLRVRIKRNRKVIRKSAKQRVVKQARKKVREFRVRIRKINPRIKAIEKNFRVRQHVALGLWRAENRERSVVLDEDLTELAALLQSDLASIRDAWADEVFAVEFPDAEDAFDQENDLVDQLFDEGTAIIAAMPVQP